ncbi:3-ketoacyl-ACP reductase [Jeotgalicoccus coquinae]|uniref:Diacetyl reductase [(S)-acetoin forming] n=1 Tax=Jeotgalicoccus coquinae TaxID=709509 RepID=A0A6V7R1J5_9STAP|nr:glucose 1-dehydrogenase [Jeotgalicoccus coquinae]MBB6423646.1 NAD(P)-dependent dehydrogenase (short-subunit alcohol dehydrogenase family) [Jeotgalicoccus coquinae]GGE21482.1 3-ketoacyl-ACP reductase [Jeotgalicoccus coquinae]CAD2071210.1 2,5-dichloro-2,5-cyclohexadiene-1,4-diol dehydrogenase [Jeotgalicoccus coquinae]
MRLQDKVAIVTGAASGMGKAIAEAYAREGAKVVVSDLNIEGAEEVAANLKANGAEAFAIKTNVSVEEEVEQLFEETKKNFGKLDILVNNAGIMDGMEPVGEISNERWEMLFAVNTTAVMKSMRLAVNLFLEQGHGTIVNNISAGGLYGGRAGAAYTASKHAVVGLTKNTAFMYADKNIRTNGIAPGAVKTNIASSMKNMSEFGAGRQSQGMSLNPRAGEPEEIAEAAVFLGSDEASFVNGQVLAADGGWTAY